MPRHFRIASSIKFNSKAIAIRPGQSLIVEADTFPPSSNNCFADGLNRPPDHWAFDFSKESF